MVVVMVMVVMTAAVLMSGGDRELNLSKSFLII